MNIQKDGDMKKAYHIIRGWVCTACLCLLAAACSQMDGGWSDDASCDGDGHGGSPAGTMFLSVRFSVGGSGPEKRANPGEDGDGREPGDDNENAVTGVTVFLFDESADWNTTDGCNASILAAYYFKTGDDLYQEGTSYVTEAVSVEDLGVDCCKALAVVNVDWTGNVSNRTWTVLGHLRDVPVEDDWLWQGTDPENIRKTNFLMSSTELVSVTGINGSTKENPATVRLDVERLAARVDYRTRTVNGVFDVTDAGGQTVGQVTVEGAIVVNRLTGKENLFKHVAKTYPSTLAEAEIGRETVDGSGQAANWVVDAFPGGRKEFDLFLPTLSSHLGWADEFSTGFPMTDVGGTEWHCLGYVRENTNEISQAAELRQKATGVVFKARYDVTGFTSGHDLYRYGGKLYPDLSSVAQVAGIPEDGLTNENCAGYGITYYPGGICYYTYWIKHAEDGDNDHFGTMEYAIVRNNLYQLTVTSVSGIGDPQPGDSELAIEVAVRNWQAMDEENVDLQ